MFALIEGTGAEGTGRLVAAAAADELRQRFNARLLVRAADLQPAIESVHQRIAGVCSSPVHAGGAALVALLVVTHDVAHALVHPDLEVLHVVQSRLASTIPCGASISLRLRAGDALVVCSSKLRELVEAAEIIRILGGCTDPDQAAAEILALATSRDPCGERSVLVIWPDASGDHGAAMMAAGVA